MDAFYASVEIRDNPELKGKPLIIGSLPTERGVVATASYEARKYGVHSGMNIKEAYRLCPKGIYMHPDMEKYKSVSGQLHEIWRSYATELEAVAFDEAYLDVKEKAKDIEGARRIAREIKQRTLDELRLTCSVGLAYSKTAAKTASEEKKPDGYFEILTPEDFVNLVIDRDVRALYTVGAMTAEKLYSYGIHTVRDIMDKQDIVVNILGKHTKGVEEYMPTRMEMRQQSFCMYINDLCNSYRKNHNKLVGMSEIREKHHITGITKDQFFACGLHQAKGYVSQDFTDRLYDYILDNTKNTPAPLFKD